MGEFGDELTDLSDKLMPRKKCAHCGGSGYHGKRKCPVCKGTGFVRKS